jgi:hypothetical protein
MVQLRLRVRRMIMDNKDIRHHAKCYIQEWIFDVEVDDLNICEFCEEQKIEEKYMADIIDVVRDIMAGLDIFDMLEGEPND